MPLSPEQEELCERVEKGEPAPRAAALIRQQAHEIDDLWDRLSRAYARVMGRFTNDNLYSHWRARDDNTVRPTRVACGGARTPQLRIPDRVDRM